MVILIHGNVTLCFVQRREEVGKEKILIEVRRGKGREISLFTVVEKKVK